MGPIRTAALASMVLSLSLFAVAHASAQPSATLSMSADRSELTVGEQIRMQVRADVTGGSADDLVLPDLAAFHIVSRRVARPMQFSFGFGSQRRTVQSSVVYDLVLQATQPGTFELQPATLTLGTETYRSDPLTIVVKEALHGSTTPPGPAQPPTGSLDGAEFDPQAFVRTVVDDREVFVGQQTTITVYLYVRGNLRSAPQVSRAPTTDGFWVHDLLPVQRSLNAQHQAVNGVSFDVYVIRRLAAFPLQAGALTVGAPTITLETGSVFDLFNRASGGTLRREGVPVAVTAKPLPSSGRPAGSIAVGQWAIDASLDRSEVATGDAVTLRATVQGVGNPLELDLNAPRVDGLRFLAPEIDETVRSPSDLVQGSRTWRWLIIPERPGSFRIGPLRLPTFDPATDSYEVLTTPTLRLQAAGNPTTSDVPLGVEPPTGTSSEPLDLSPIRRESELLPARKPLWRNPGYVVALAAPPAVFGLLLVVTVIRRIRRRPARRGRGARRDGKRRLQLAHERTASGELDGFYAEARKVLVDAIESKLHSKIGGFTYPQLREHLTAHGMNPDLVKLMVDELEGTEFARFSAEGASDREVARCSEAVGVLLDRLDEFDPTSEAAP